LTNVLWQTSIASPIGRLVVVADHAAVRAAFFEEYTDSMQKWLRKTCATDRTEPGDPFEVGPKFTAYFAGEIDALTGIQVEAAGTSFQRTVWQALLRIPAGRTLTYGQLARQLGNPTATRAVGLANGSNPISLIIPCHRVIGANGSLTGYGGGLHRKQWLLQHEGAQLSLP